MARRVQSAHRTTVELLDACLSLREACREPGPRSGGCEVAWAAGFFEGEGCVGKSGTAIRITMTHTDLDVLTRFRDIVGGQIASKKVVGNRKPAWGYAMNSPERILLLFVPYLGQRRLARVLELVEERIPYLEGKLQEKFCKECGASFVPTYSHSATRHSYCRVECRSRAHIKRHAKPVEHLLAWERVPT